MRLPTVIFVLSHECFLLVGIVNVAGGHNDESYPLSKMLDLQKTSVFYIYYPKATHP